MNAILFWTLLNAITPAAEPSGIADSYPPIPFGARPIDYWTRTDTDPVERLKQRLESGATTLPYDDRFGYLPALLRELKIAPESQVLKWTSGSPHRSISRDTPRAIYYRDDVAVAWFPGTTHIEIAVQDPRHGTHFHTVTSSAAAPLRWERPQSCLGCHVGPNTGTNVPGWQLHVGVERSAVADHPWEHRLSHAMPFVHRWKQLYLSGPFAMPWPSGTVLSKEIPSWLTERYPMASSDPAAALVRDHWLLGMNLLTRWSFEQQMNESRGETMEALVRYLLMSDEAPLPMPLPADTAFTRHWNAAGQRDAQGRSLRDLDLQTRTFRYAVSPLLLTRMVQDQSRDMRAKLYQRLFDELGQSDTLRVTETHAVLTATVPDWHTVSSVRTHSSPDR